MTKDNLNSPIHKDFRGEIRRFDINGTKFNVLTTKAGCLRSGDYHPHTQFNLILKGELEITLRQNDKDVVIRKRANELVVIPLNTPHLFKSVTDTIMVEWWDGPMVVNYYSPYRKLIEEQFKKAKK